MLLLCFSYLASLLSIARKPCWAAPHFTPCKYRDFFFLINHKFGQNSKMFGRDLSIKCEVMDSTIATQQGDRSFRERQCAPSMQRVTLKCSGEIADQLMEALMCFGAYSVSAEDAKFDLSLEQQTSIHEPVPWDVGRRQLWDQNKLTALFPPGEDVGECISFSFNSVGLMEMLPYEVEEAENQDWVQQVKESFRPVQIVDDLWIVPKWRTPPIDSAMNVILDPGFAFGTGEHPTTRLCIRWLKDSVKGGEHILDYGTGSGILAIAALKMGAVKAIGLDIDPMALSSTIHNAALNGFGSESLEVFLVTVHGGVPIPLRVGLFNIVVANILLNPLLELSAQITSYARPGGLVGVSGILISQVDQVQERYSVYLDNIHILEEDGWACVTGTTKH